MYGLLLNDDQLYKYAADKAPDVLAFRVIIPNRKSPPRLPNMIPNILLNSSHNDFISHVAII